jgi:hypothetical protein
MPGYDRWFPPRRELKPIVHVTSRTRPVQGPSPPLERSLLARLD